LNTSFATLYALAISGVHGLAARYGLFLLVLLFITDVSILLISVSGSYRDSYSGAYPGPSYNRLALGTYLMNYHSHLLTYGVAFLVLSFGTVHM
jgi:hypothetical protein